MIDTAAINLGINRLQEAFSYVQPKINELTIQFIQYTAIQQILCNGLAVAVFVIMIIIYLPVWKYGKGKKDFYDNFDEPGFILLTVLIGIIAMVALVASVTMLPGTILAINFPEMFAIQQIISNTK